MGKNPEEIIVANQIQNFIENYLTAEIYTSGRWQ